ncbi:hypothetical protein K8T06_11890 [bacterium]|nr:hypothetical protein [bacterium]
MKLNRFENIMCLLILLITLSGCASTLNLSIAHPYLLQPCESDHGQLPATSPERCHNALLESFQEDTDHGLVRTIKYANTMLKEWPWHIHAASSAHLAAWAVLFTDVSPVLKRQYDLYDWDRYLTVLLTASHFFEVSAGSDSSSEGIWTSEAGNPLNLIHEGYRETEALEKYLDAKRITKIRVLKYQQESDALDAIKKLEEIDSQHSDWSDRFGINREKDEMMNAVALMGIRILEAQKIFK